MHTLDKIKLQRAAYAKMDETALNLYGISRRRMAIVHLVRSKGFASLQCAMIILYTIFIIGVFILHDIYIDEIAKEIYLNEENDRTASKVAIIFEFVILSLFLLDLLLHCVGYGFLYMRQG